MTSRRRPAPAEPRPLRKPSELIEAGLRPPEAGPALEAAAAIFPILVPPALAALIDANDPDDPLARQFLPAPEELAIAADERADPIGDSAHAPVPGLIHRYPDRVLLTPVMRCAVHCRFCFRREAVGKESPAPAGAAKGAEMLDEAALQAALDYIGARPEIFEVILSGGDPLTLSDRRLGRLLDALEGIGHVAVIRIHTRTPIARPERITPALVRLLRRRPAVYVVLHCNHERELAPAALKACGRMSDRGIPLLAQTVLLRGVNDSIDALEALMRRLVAARIKPYYLHHPDLARGTAHLRNSLEEGRALVAELRRRASGLCQPVYVLDIPGGYGKVPCGPSSLSRGPEGWLATDPQGRRHPYPPRP